MSNVFKTQTLLKLIGKTKYKDLSGAEVTRIIYTKPSGATGYWDAEVSGRNLIYDVTAGDIDEEGEWEWQTYIEIDGLIGYGKKAKRLFETPIVVV